MRLFDHSEVESRLDWTGLIAALRDGFAEGTMVAPARQVLTIDQPEGRAASLLVMPAWEAGAAIGVKVVTFFPQNAERQKPTINAGYLLFDGSDGTFRAAMDGDALTARRTAAASALATDYLARRSARSLLICGTGQLAAGVAEAMATVRTLGRIVIWGRSGDKAAALAARLRDAGLPATMTDDLQAACAEADIVSSVTASTAPFIKGEWLPEGCHLDLIGSFKRDMRESDDLAVTQARVFVDGRDGAVLSGDLAQPIEDGIFSIDRIVADLSELARGAVQGRRSETERTLFKSVGLSQEDLIAAMQVVAADQLRSG